MVPDEPTHVTVASQDYRNAMSHFAGAVHIATTNGISGIRGVTISAACSLSDEPPTILICLMRNNPDNQFFIKNKNFALNTLAGHHQPLSDAFSGKGGLLQNERFEIAKWQNLTTGAPVLEDALASFDCKLVSWNEHDTHYVLIGEVVAIKRNQSQNALLYLNRAYHTLDL